MAISSSSSTSNTIKFTGLGSGIDTTALMQSMLAVVKQPISGFQSKQAKITQQQAAWQSLNTRMLALGNQADKLKETDTYAVRQARVADNTLFTATASPGQDVGSYQVSVEALAQQHQLISSGYALQDAKLGKGTIQISVGPAQFNPITIGEGQDTLEGVRDAINASSSGVQASILDTGAANGATRYKLVLNSNTSGSDGRITVDMHLSGGTTPTFSDLSPPQDAHIKLNGVDIYSSSNTLKDMIPGVTLQLQKADPGVKTQLSLSNNTAAVDSAVQSMLDQYNALADSFTENFSYDKETGTAGTLFGDATAMSLQQQVVDVVNNAHSVGGKYNSLASMGIGLDAKGHLSVTDMAAYDKAMQNPGEVKKLFTDPDHGLSSAIKKLVEASTNSVTGTITQENRSLQDGYDALDKNIAAKNAQVTRTQMHLETMFTAMESTLSQLKSQSDNITAQLAAFTTANSSSNKK